jgi:hypothetical protein
MDLILRHKLPDRTKFIYPPFFSRLLNDILLLNFWLNACDTVVSLLSIVTGFPLTVLTNFISKHIKTNKDLHDISSSFLFHTRVYFRQLIWIPRCNRENDMETYIWKITNKDKKQLHHRTSNVNCHNTIIPTRPIYAINGIPN